MTTTVAMQSVVGGVASARRAGRLCAWAGLLGALSGVFLALVPASVPDDRYSYPLSAAGFVAIQLFFAVQHLGLLAGIVGLGRCGAVGASMFGVRLASVGMIGLALTELAAISAASSTYPDGLLTGALDAAYGLTTVAIGVGLTVAGAQVVRAGVWHGWRRWLPLALGVWVFVPMIPALFGPFLGARLAITAWMLLFAALGYALAREQPR